ncbi:DUF4998 domain-containing protein [Desertivirga xinjiangensis]|uniref:DUF4998 domain-containing protein n=1 Tax=Desertivirga xinjiangensis TaxID=539206 RepID=UPI002108C3E1|nr:DUF4998 domain-containing protein [Pedobacter xinjiangensis]
MKSIFYITNLLFGLFILTGCEKYADDYKDYLNDEEIVYPGLARNVRYYAGNQRAVLVWNPSPDRSIERYIIFWNNGEDSVSVAATSYDPEEDLSVSIPNLNEYAYSFQIVAVDREGRKSIGQEINNVRVYGPVYQSTLTNRPYKTANPFVRKNDGSVELNFGKADSLNFSTTIRYTNVNNQIEERELAAESNSISLPNYKTGTAIQYRSSYKPEKDAADAINVEAFEELPVELDRALIAPFRLPSDIRSEYGWELQYLWDNNTGEPGFHTPGTSMPQWFSIDLGVNVPLVSFSLWQRISGLFNYGNLKKFEVWGSNNPNPDGSWESWTKLMTCNSFKPSGQPVGQNSDADRAFAEAGEPFVFPAGTPDVRYLRFKVLDTWGNTNYLHLVELKFFRKLGVTN